MARGDADCDAESSAKEGERADNSSKELQNDPAMADVSLLLLEPQHNPLM